MKHIKLFESFVNESESKGQILTCLNDLLKLTKEEVAAINKIGLDKLPGDHLEGFEYTDEHYKEFIHDVKYAIGEIEEFYSEVKANSKYDFTSQYNLCAAVTAFANGGNFEDFIMEQNKK